MKRDEHESDSFLFDIFIDLLDLDFDEREKNLLKVSSFTMQHRQLFPFSSSRESNLKKAHNRISKLINRFCRIEK